MEWSHTELSFCFIVCVLLVLLCVFVCLCVLGWCPWLYGWLYHCFRSWLEQGEGVTASVWVCIFVCLYYVLGLHTLTQAHFKKKKKKSSHPHTPMTLTFKMTMVTISLIVTVNPEHFLRTLYYCAVFLFFFFWSFFKSCLLFSLHLCPSHVRSEEEKVWEQGKHVCGDMRYLSFSASSKAGSVTDDNAARVSQLQLLHVVSLEFTFAQTVWPDALFKW